MTLKYLTRGLSVEEGGSDQWVPRCLPCPAVPWSTGYSVWFTLHCTVQCTVQCTVYTLQCMYSLQCRVHFTVYSTVYNTAAGHLLNIGLPRRGVRNGQRGSGSQLGQNYGLKVDMA